MQSGERVLTAAQERALAALRTWARLMRAGAAFAELADADDALIEAVEQLETEASE